MKILLVDDEPLARQRLAALVRELGGHDIVAEAANGREAVELAGEHAADVVLLDVAMPVMDGLEAARHLATLPSPPALVFCTAFDQHALAAFEAAAVDYLVKPVRAERLAEALERARRHRATAAPSRLPGEGGDGQVHALLRNGGGPLEVSRRCLPALRERLKHL